MGIYTARITSLPLRQRPGVVRVEGSSYGDYLLVFDRRRRGSCPRPRRRPAEKAAALFSPSTGSGIWLTLAHPAPSRNRNQATSMTPGFGRPAEYLAPDLGIALHGIFSRRVSLRAIRSYVEGYVCVAGKRSGRNGPMRGSTSPVRISRASSRPMSGPSVTPLCVTAS